MSASIYWQPNSNNGTAINTSVPLLFLQILDNLSLTPPCVMDGRDLDRLVGAIAASDKSIKEGLEELYEAITIHGSIRITVEY